MVKWGSKLSACIMRMPLVKKAGSRSMRLREARCFFTKPAPASLSSKTSFSLHFFRFLSSSLRFSLLFLLKSRDPEVHLCQRVKQVRLFPFFFFFFLAFKRLECVVPFPFLFVFLFFITFFVCFSFSFLCFHMLLYMF